MTEKLYDKDAYGSEFNATVLSCEEDKKGFNAYAAKQTRLITVKIRRMEAGETRSLSLRYNVKYSKNRSLILE